MSDPTQTPATCRCPTTGRRPLPGRPHRAWVIVAVGDSADVDALAPQKSRRELVQLDVERPVTECRGWPAVAAG